MKKFIALLLSLALMLGVCICSFAGEALPLLRLPIFRMSAAQRLTVLERFSEK